MVDITLDLRRVAICRRCKHQRVLYPANYIDRFAKVGWPSSKACQKDDLPPLNCPDPWQPAPFWGCITPVRVARQT
jgi:hypothetical protein